MSVLWRPRKATNTAKGVLLRLLVPYICTIKVNNEGQRAAFTLTISIMSQYRQTIFTWKRPSREDIFTCHFTWNISHEIHVMTLCIWLISKPNYVHLKFTLILFEMFTEFHFGNVHVTLRDINMMIFCLYRPMLSDSGIRQSQYLYFHQKQPYRPLLRTYHVTSVVLVPAMVDHFTALQKEMLAGCASTTVLQYFLRK